MAVAETVSRLSFLFLSPADPGCSYWQFLLYLFIGLTLFELMLAPIRPIYSIYSVLIGYFGLSVEATLPLPQIFVNAQSRSCKGFRLSVLGTWLLGDAMKMFWFFTSTTEIPWAFKLCGIFQAGCDLFLGVQYLMYGSGESSTMKEHAMSQVYSNSYKPPPRTISGGVIPTGRRTPVNEKELR
jgi:solute carrier family 66, member 2